MIGCIISINSDFFELRSLMDITMAWIETTRAQYRRDALRHTNDLIDTQWVLISCFLPMSTKLAQPRKTNL